MFIAMNRFTVPVENAAEFEALWLSRDSKLDSLPGFVEFHMLKGPKAADHSLYASHAVWETEEHFQAWTKSEQFRAAHARAGESKVQYLSGPHFEGFEVIIHEDRDGKRVDEAA